MPDPASKSEYGPGTGSGRRIIPADLYLSRWSHVVDLLKAGKLSREIKETYGRILKVAGILADMSDTIHSMIMRRILPVAFDLTLPAARLLIDSQASEDFIGAWRRG